MHILEKIIHQTINMYMLMLWTKYVLSTLEITIIRRYLSSFPLICLTFLTNFDQCRELVSYNHIMYTKHYTTKQCMYFLFILERCSTATTNMSNSKSPHATTLEIVFTHLKLGSFLMGDGKSHLGGAYLHLILSTKEVKTFVFVHISQKCCCLQNTTSGSLVFALYWPLKVCRIIYHMSLTSWTISVRHGEQIQCENQNCHILNHGDTSASITSHESHNVPTTM